MLARSFSAFLLLGLGATPAAAEITAIWVATDGEKILADDLDRPPDRKNPIFDAESARVSLIAGKNETVAFQVVMRGGNAEGQATLRFDALSGAAGTIKNDDNVELGGLRGHRIDLFLEHYAQIRVRSAGIGWEPDSWARPHGYADNWVPDALVPMPSGKPFTVPAKRNQAVWVDIYIPAATKPGVYQGALTVEPCALPACKLNVSLEVIDATLPPSPSQKTMVWFSGGDNDLDVMAARYLNEPEPENPAVQKLRDRHFQLARRHRITLFLGQYDAPNPVLERELTGKLFTPGEGYEGPGEGVPQDICVLHAYGDGELTPEMAKTWTEWLDKLVPQGATKLDRIYYTVDEPGEGQFAEVNKRAAAGKPVPSFVTSMYEPKLGVDVYATLPIWWRKKDNEAASAAGKRLWVYNGMRPYSGSFLIDDSLLSPLVNGWIQFGKGVERWFYWESTYYKDTQGGRHDIDVWNQPDNFANQHGDVANGDGLLFYPGRDLIFPDSDRGIDYPLPSMRLKAWRRGLQDADHLVIARSLGLNEFVDELVDTMIPYSLGDRLSRRDQVPWLEDPNVWATARVTLLTAIRDKQAKEIPDALEHRYIPFRMRFVLKWGLRGGAVMAVIVALWWWRRRRRRG